MAGLKNIMIDSLRDGSELSTAWQLRKSFLNQNLNANDGPEYKEHLIMLSRCFVGTVLGQKQNYPSHIVEETRSRSWGLESDVSRALLEMQNTSYQASQASAAASASSYYQRQRPDTAIPYDYTKEQVDQQGTSFNGQGYQTYDQGQGNQRTPYGQSHQASAVMYGQGQQSSAMYNQSQQDLAALSYVQSYSASTTSSYGQNSQNPAASYGQSQLGSFSSYGHGQPNAMNSYVQNQQGTASPYVQNQQATASPYGQNQQGTASLYGQNQQGTASTYGQNQQDSAALQNKSQQSHPSGAFSSYGKSKRESASSYGQSQRDSGSFGQSRQSSASSSYGKNENDSSMFCPSEQDLSSYGQRRQDVGSYQQSQQHSLLQTLNPLSMLQTRRSTVYTSQTPTAYHDKGPGKRNAKTSPAFPKRPQLKERMVDSHALSIIPARKGHPNKGIPKELSKNTLKKQRKRAREIAGIAAAKHTDTNPYFVKANTLFQNDGGDRKIVNNNNNAPSQTAQSTFPQPRTRTRTRNKKPSTQHAQAELLQSCFERKPLFDHISNEETRETVEEKEEEENDASDANLSSEKKDSCPNADPQADGTKEKLRLIFDMAEYYSKLENESSDPYAALQKCAASAKQKVRCDSKSSVNSQGQKEIKCEVFANEIQLVSIVLTGGTNPDEAKKKLAIAVLEKIALPQLRLVANGEDGLKLEGSSTPFADTVAKSSATASVASSAAIEKKDGSSECDSSPKKDTTVNNQQDSINTNRRVPVNFDSYVAWRCEKHLALKRVRQLGHLYATLPFKHITHKPSNSVAVLQLFANVTDISLEIKVNVGAEESSSGKYSLVMDGKIVLFSWDALEQNHPVDFISKSVLQRVSRPYLCLVKNILHVSNKPFRDRAYFNPSSDVVWDTWQLKYGLFRDKFATPVRVEDLCLFQTHQEPNAYTTLVKSIGLCDKKLKPQSCFSENRRIKFVYYTVTQKVIGGIRRQVPKSGVVKINNVEVGNVCLKNLRKSHWTIRKLHLSKAARFVFAGELFPHLESQPPDTQTEAEELKSSNKGHQLLAKMGWSGKGIGKREDGIKEPISSSELLSANSEMGLKNKTPDPSNIRKMTDSSKVKNEELIEAYDSAPIHRDLYIPCQFGSERGKIFKLAESFGMKASTRGVQRNKRVLLSKNIHACKIVSNCLELGGKSDVYELIPPQEVRGFEFRTDPFEEMNHAIKANSVAKSIAKRAEKNALKEFNPEANKASDAGSANNANEAGSVTGRDAIRNVHSNRRHAAEASKRFASKSVQCTLIDAPKLERFEPLKEELCERNCDEEEEGPFVSLSECGGDYDDFDEEFIDDVYESYSEDEAEEEEYSTTDRSSYHKKRKLATGLESDIAGVFKKRKI